LGDVFDCVGREMSGDDFMIRFIDLGKQIAVDETDPEWPRQFAFYDTVDDTFVSFDGTEVWDSWGEFESDLIYMAETDMREFPYRTELKKETLKRFRGLCPDWVFAHRD
jgi:hypothetical protein